jgi:hypothetical protein
MPGLLRGVARTAAVAGTATAVSNRVSRRQASKWSAQEAQAAPAAPPPAAPPAGGDPAERIAELARLHEQGALTDAEFAAAKAKILGI